MGRGDELLAWVGRGGGGGEWSGRGSRGLCEMAGRRGWGIILRGGFPDGLQRRRALEGRELIGTSIL